MEKHMHLQKLKILKYINFLQTALISLKKGFKTIVVTNQPDVGNNKISKNTLKNAYCSKKKTKVNQIYACVHTAKENCSCRKPMPGMLLKARKRHKINFKKSYMVGDRLMDIKCGKKVGCKTIFINRNYKEKIPSGKTPSVKNLKEATETILNDLKK